MPFANNYWFECTTHGFLYIHNPRALVCLIVIVERLVVKVKWVGLVGYFPCPSTIKRKDGIFEFIVVLDN